MNRRILFTSSPAILAILMVLTSGAAQDLIEAPQQTTSSTFMWSVVPPEQVGIRSADLIPIFDYIQDEEVNIHSLLLIRGGAVFLEAYFYPNEPEILHDVASVTKSITSALVGIALDKGLIESINEPVLSFFPDRQVANLDGRKRRMTIEDLLTMRTGFCQSYSRGEAMIDEMRRTDDWIQYVLDQPMVSEPGSEFVYCTPASHLLSAILTRVTGMSELAFARAHLFGPLGIQEVEWPTDPHGHNTGGFDLFLHVRDMAKIGYLFLREGWWGDQQVISREWVRRSTAAQVQVDERQEYGYRWWIPNDVAGLYEARGRGGQRIAIWPQEDLVAILTGSGFEPGEIGARLLPVIGPLEPLPEDADGYRALMELIVDTGQPPEPEPVPPLPPIAREISGVRFDFESNPLDLAAFSLTFDGSSEALLYLLETDGEEEENPIGLDGVYRLSDNSRFGLPEALRGEWTGPSEFHLRYNEFANNHIWDITFRFEGNRAAVRFVEGTGLMDRTVIARRSVPYTDKAKEAFRAENYPEAISLLSLVLGPLLHFPVCLHADHTPEHRNSHTPLPGGPDRGEEYMLVQVLTRIRLRLMFAIPLRHHHVSVSHQEPGCISTTRGSIECRSIVSRLSTLPVLSVPIPEAANPWCNTCTS